MTVMSIAQQPLWQVGFRPFFTLALLAGMLLPTLWVLLLDGTLSLPAGRIGLLQWHAHEMFYGFGWALLGGFLLTATKNWVSVRGYHGIALLLPACAWLGERIVVGFGAALPAPLFWLGVNLFLPALVLMLMHTLWRHRASDSFRDNYLFLLALPAFILAKNLLLMPEHFALGWGLTLGLFRLAFLVMLERTLVPFMKSACQVDLPRYPWLDNGIKLLGLLLVGAVFMPDTLAAGLNALLALLLLARFALWQPLRALRRIDVGIMYLGYLALALQLLFAAVALLWQPAWTGSLPVHLFAFGVMGLIIPAMVVRISKGHTGRKVSFDRADKLALQIMLLAFLARIVGPQFGLFAYQHWLHIAAACWLVAFALLAWRYVPMYFAPRVDGRIH